VRRLQYLDAEGALKTAASVSVLAAPDALLVSRLELEQYLLELPPLPEKRLKPALEYRLGALYPGALDSARIDYLRNKSRGNAFILFVMSEDALAAHRRSAGSLPLVSPTLIAAGMAPRGEWNCVFWTRGWASLDRFDDRKLAESLVVGRSGEIRDDWSRLMRKRGAADPGAATVLVTEDAAEDSPSLEALLSEEGFTSLKLLPLARILARIRLSDALLFPQRPRIRKRRRFAIAALAILDALSALALAIGYARSLEEEGASLKESYLRMQGQNGAALLLTEEAEAKEEKYRALIALKPPDGYELISSIATGAGEGTRILSLALKDGGFEMEAEGRDALATLALLEASPRLGGIKLRRSLRAESGLERFSISGNCGDAGP
jgi:hypothetical protein